MVEIPPARAPHRRDPPSPRKLSHEDMESLNNSYDAKLIAILGNRPASAVPDKRKHSDGDSRN